MMNDDDEFFGEETKNLKELESWNSLQSTLWTALLDCLHSLINHFSVS